VHSEPSPASVAIASLRVSFAPSVNECDETVALRAVRMCMLATWNASSRSSCTL